MGWPRCHTGYYGAAHQASRRHKDQQSTQPLRRGRRSQNQLWLQRTLQPRAALALLAARPRRRALQRGRRASGCAACQSVHLHAFALAAPERVTLQTSEYAEMVAHCTGLYRHLCGSPLSVMQSATEGADEDNESLGGSSNQLGRGSLAAASGTWRSPASPYDLDRSASRCVCVTNFCGTNCRASDVDGHSIATHAANVHY